MEICHNSFNNASLYHAVLHHAMWPPITCGAGPALRRAALAARRIAKATNTPLVIWENGKVVEKWIR